MTLDELYTELGSDPTPERMEELVELIDDAHHDDNLANIPKIVIDPSHVCHICRCYTKGECEFDIEMNPHSTPSPCCGHHGCAEDV